MTTENQTTPEQRITDLERKVDWLYMQLMNAYVQLQMPLATSMPTATPTARTDVGMGAIVAPEKSSYI